MKMHENRNNNMSSLDEEGNQFTTITETMSSNSIKRPLTLDLNAATNNNKRQTRKQGFNQSVIATPVLNSPDINMLKMATPDLEKFIISNACTLQTPTPSLPFPANNATREQEDFSRGFEDALNIVRKRSSEQQQFQQVIQQQPQIQQNGTTIFTSAAVTIGNIVTNPPVTATPATSTILSTAGMSGGTVTLRNLDDNSYPVTIKNEPQTGPNSPRTMSPIDMENQEKIKLERKRQRNRVAASKCRKRKLERISKLEDKVKSLKGENLELGGVIKSLKEHVFHLKQQVIDHINNGCSIPSCNISYKNDSDIK